MGVEASGEDDGGGGFFFFEEFCEVLVEGLVPLEGEGVEIKGGDKEVEGGRWKVEESPEETYWIE